MHLVHRRTEAEVRGLSSDRIYGKNSPAGWEASSKKLQILGFLEFDQLHPEQMDLWVSLIVSNEHD